MKPVEIKKETMPVLNPHLNGFKCIRCSAHHPVADYPEGCPACLDAGYPASVEPLYALSLPAIAFDRTRRGMERFSPWLAYSGFDTLGEGDTPLVSLPRLAGELGLETLHVKLESSNPTGSHKDRMSAQFVARAKHRGAPAVIAASSGNAGASLAAYAARAGLACEIVTTRAIKPAWRRAIEMTGARITYTQDAMQRWVIVRRKVAEEGYATATNYLDPPVGSDPYGVEGYKTLGYELAEDVNAAQADVVIVPTSRGDVLWGVYKGMAEAVAAGICPRLPRLVAAEPFPRISQVLSGADYRDHFPGGNKLSSLGGTTVTYQAVKAILHSKGDAISVTEPDAIADQLALAANGLYVELSSSASLTALRSLLVKQRQNVRRALLIATSHGYKEEG